MTNWLLAIAVGLTITYALCLVFYHFYSMKKQKSVEKKWGCKCRR